MIVARSAFDSPYVPPYADAPGGGIGKFDKSQTRQADTDGTDINKIMAKYEKTGTLPDLIVREPRYGDFSDAVDYQEALNLVIFSQHQFANLDAPIRNRFENDPAKFLEFVNDENNRDEIIDLGLAKPGTLNKAQLAAKAEADAKAAGASPTVNPT